MSEEIAIFRSEIAFRDETITQLHLEQEELVQRLHLRDDLLQKLEQTLGAWETVVRGNEFRYTELENSMVKKDEIIARLKRDIDDRNGEVLKLRRTLDTAGESIQQLQHNLEAMQLERQTYSGGPTDARIGNDAKAVDPGSHVQSLQGRSGQSHTTNKELKTDTHPQDTAPQTNTGHLLTPNSTDVVRDHVPTRHSIPSSMVGASGDNAGHQGLTFDADLNWSIFEEIKGERDRFKQDLFEMEKKIYELTSLKAESDNKSLELTTKMQMREDNLKSENRRLVAEVQSFTKSLEKRNAQIDLIGQELKEKTEDVASLSEKCETLKQTVNKLQSTSRHTENELENTRQKIEELEPDYKCQEEAREEAAKKGASNLDKQKQEIQKHQCENEVLRDKLQNITESLQNKDVQLKAKNEEVSSLSKEIETLEESLDKSQETLRDTENELETAMQRVKDLERDFKCLQKDRVEVSNSHKDREELQKLEFENQGFKDELQNITESLEDKNSQITLIRRELKEKTEEVSSLSEKCRTLEETIYDTKATSGHTENEFEKAKLDKQSEEIQKLESENRVLKDQLENITQTLEDKDEEIALITQELKEESDRVLSLSEICKNWEETFNKSQATPRHTENEVHVHVPQHFVGHAAQQSVEERERDRKHFKEENGKGANEGGVNIDKQKESEEMRKLEGKNGDVKEELQNVTESPEEKDAQFTLMDKELKEKTQEVSSSKRHITGKELQGTMQSVKEHECEYKLLEENSGQAANTEEVQELRKENQRLTVDLKSMTTSLEGERSRYAVIKEELRTKSEEVKSLSEKCKTLEETTRKSQVTTWRTEKELETDRQKVMKLEREYKLLEDESGQVTNQGAANLGKANEEIQKRRKDNDTGMKKSVDAPGTENVASKITQVTSTKSVNGDNTNQGENQRETESKDEKSDNSPLLDGNQELTKAELRKQIEVLHKLNEESKKIISKNVSDSKELQEKSSNRVDKLVTENKKVNKELQETRSSLHRSNTESQSLKEELADKQSKLIENGQRIQESINNGAALQAQNGQLQQELARIISELADNRTQFSECSKRWNQTCQQKEAAEEDTEKMRKRKAVVYWHLMIRLVKEQNSNVKMRGQFLLSVREVSRELADLKNLSTSKDREHETTVGELRDENTRLGEELYAAQEETRTTTAKLTDKLEELGVEKKNLQDHVTHYMFTLEQKEGAVTIAQAWVKKMSEECVQRKAREELLSQQVTVTQRLLEEKEQQYQTLRSVTDEREQQIGQLRNEIQIQQDQQRVYQERLQLANTQTSEQKDIVSALTEEIDRAEGAIRHAYRQDEEKVHELQRKEEGKQRLIRDILNLRRQLESVTSERDRLRKRCQQLQDELYFPAH